MPYHTNTKKYAGLSRLADVAAQAQGDEPYPVKRKPWDTRKLNPNWSGIEWLESEHNDFEYNCEIDYTENVGEEGYPELVYLYASGRTNKTYARPMFQIMPRDAFHTSAQRIEKPCTACWNFHRSWACEEHGEREYDFERQLFLSPRQVERDEQDRRLDPSLTVRGFRVTGADLTGRSFSSICQAVARLASLSPETISIDGLFNPAAIRPILGTDRWEITVEAETEQYRGSGITEAFRIEVERNG